MSAVVEVFLEAWGESDPVGFTLDERHASSLLFTLGAHIPGPGGSLGLAARARALSVLFVPAEWGARDRAANITDLLRAKDGRVHFLYFWRALSEVARLVGADPVEHKEPSGDMIQDLERLRDHLLQLFEADDTESISASDLAGVVMRNGSESSFGDFWREASECIAASQSSSDSFGLEELTELLLSWLHDAVMWLHEPVANLRTGMLPVNLRTGMLPMDFDDVASLSGADTLFSPQKDTTLRPGCFMASAALVLDMKEHWRAAGLLGVTGQPRSHVGSSRCSPVSSLAPLLEESLEEAAAAPEPPKSPKPSPPDDSDSPFAPNDAGTLPALNLIPPGAPPAMNIINPRTAMVPLLGSSGVSLQSSGVGLEVFLHIYDVSKQASIQRLNGFLAHRKSPVKFGGVFHAGVEVNGCEWSYGSTHDPAVSGVTCVDPKEDPQHHFRQTVTLERTSLSEREVDEVISSLREEYLGGDYNLLRRNCCHFSDDLCQRLGVGRIPGWVYRLSRIGARIDDVKPRARRGGAGRRGGGANRTYVALEEDDLN